MNGKKRETASARPFLFSGGIFEMSGNTIPSFPVPASLFSATRNRRPLFGGATKVDMKKLPHSQILLDFQEAFLLVETAEEK
jgi:hypothetical protein